MAPAHPLTNAARLLDGTIAALDVTRDRWIWLTPDAARVLDTVLLHGTTAPLAEALSANGADGADERRVHAVLRRAENALAADGLLPPPPGTVPLPEAEPATGPPAGTGRPRWRHRLPAAVGLALAVAAVKLLPLRWLLTVLATVRLLPPARPDRAAALHDAVLSTRPGWWPGRLACLEVATATVTACALTGRRVHLVLGARPLPNEAHAWTMTPAGEAFGAHDPDRPWTPIHTTPRLPTHAVTRTGEFRVAES
ncbi:lasso peptide biosynthesis B2 protein [Streptomyces johnsoniae]|uniref:Lasso peptide biosynthesis B2 protein n=1 Tax=Streptomyces johnsoniae TaxID=3075532 RepID=A0ABU2SD26_9ACTN|nr:lasso peptide biosynthesis B2 protein [Streptomyces sp. DSM 41886]MDT0446797.1 lasso peptide biosynthesis B2 protein [Streptomyces sp. DSM 41886]